MAPLLGAPGRLWWAQPCLGRPCWGSLDRERPWWAPPLGHLHSGASTREPQPRRPCWAYLDQGASTQAPLLGKPRPRRPSTSGNPTDTLTRRPPPRASPRTPRPGRLHHGQANGRLDWDASTPDKPMANPCLGQADQWDKWDESATWDEPTNGTRRPMASTQGKAWETDGKVLCYVTTSLVRLSLAYVMLVDRACCLCV